MVIDTQRLVLLWCPHCGLPSRRRFSLFDAEPPGPDTLSCSCGQIIGGLSRGRREWVLEASCRVCGRRHRLLFGNRDLARSQLMSLTCPGSQTELGLVGEEALVASLEMAIREAVGRG